MNKIASLLSKMQTWMAAEKQLYAAYIGGLGLTALRLSLSLSPPKTTIYMHSTKLTKRGSRCSGHGLLGEHG